ncbi:hypothetical protein BC830DRAFT_1117647 [Chytriomyces sp. MP71]|nr:hypothetical protein BC830DRAFT_1117647 [Chytriomyces sp. MP71]
MSVRGMVKVVLDMPGKGTLALLPFTLAVGMGVAPSVSYHTHELLRKLSKVKKMTSTTATDQKCTCKHQVVDNNRLIIGAIYLHVHIQIQLHNKRRRCACCEKAPARHDGLLVRR